jgi:asparagine synthase (glutamine-hydrolysing)
MRDFAGVDDVGVVQALFSWVRPREIDRLLLPTDGVAPARRLFEPHWRHTLPAGASRIDRLSSLMVEANIRLILPNDFLFKVDTASMRHSLEVRVPLLDEDLMAFGMSLPHRLRVDGRSGKRVLRTIARRHLPERVVDREKQGFALPVDSWVTPECKTAMAEVLLDPGARVNEYLARDVHADWVESFCSGATHPELPRMALYQRVIMVLALELALADAA